MSDEQPGALPGAPSQLESVALKIVSLAKALIVADNHFLSAAIGRLAIAFGTFERPMATNGQVLGLNPRLLCRAFQTAKQAPKHDLLHTTLHCVFLHPYVDPSVNRRLWNLACDIAIERNVAMICGPRAGHRGEQIADALNTIDPSGKGAVAERVYRELRHGAWADRIDTWEELFSSDDHAPWYAQNSPQDTPDAQDGQNNEQGASDPQQQNSATSTGNTNGNGQSQANRTSGDKNQSQAEKTSESQGQSPNQDSGGQSQGSGSPHDQAPGQENSPRTQGKNPGSASQTAKSTSPGAALVTRAAANLETEREEWRRVARALAVNLQTYAKGRGKELSSMVNELEETSHQRVDYSEFLRQFAIPGEVLRVSPDEFDYVFYTYGLSLYGNLPLIEPLEYREEKLVREFVIVIDTSGSVWGDIVRKFIDTTFDILKSTEAFFERVHIRIIQCDASVQSDDVIANLNELKEWGSTMQLHGGGGTDFRPAFAYVDKLIENGEFENLGGLIYFTDGWGTYPEWMPEYKVAFAFYDEDYRPEIVPTWAAQVVLDQSSLG